MTSSTPTPPPSSPSAGGGEIIYPQQPPKDPVLILVLNLLLLGGVGYIIIGQKMKGIAAIVLWLLGLFTPGRASIFCLTSCPRTGPMPHPGAVSVILIFTF